MRKAQLLSLSEESVYVQLKGLLGDFTQPSRVSFYTGMGNIVPRLVTYLTDFFEENKEFLMIFGKIWNFKEGSV